MCIPGGIKLILTSPARQCCKLMERFFWPAWKIQIYFKKQTNLCSGSIWTKNITEIIYVTQVRTHFNWQCNENAKIFEDLVFHLCLLYNTVSHHKLNNLTRVWQFLLLLLRCPALFWHLFLSSRKFSPFATLPVPPARFFLCLFWAAGG